MFLVSHSPEIISYQGAAAVNLTSEGVTHMNAYVIIVSIVCVTTMVIALGTTAIFAILAYLKEKAVLKHKNNFRDNNEISITVDDENNHSKN